MNTRELLLVIVLGSSVTTCLDAAEVKATSDPGLQVLESVFRVHNLFDKRNDVTIRLFETGSGDPAMNGDVLLLTIIPGDREQAALTWNTGIDVYTISGVELDPEHPRIVIKAREHFADTSGEIKEYTKTYTIEYAVDGETGVLSDVVRLLQAQHARRSDDSEQPSQQPY